LLHAREAIRREKKVLVVEGYFDALLLSQAGVDNVVAPCGTALTADQVRVLRRFTEDLVIAFDNDEAGRRATERAMHLFLQEGVQGLGLSMPEGMDPDDFIRQEGVDALRNGIERAEPLLEAWVLRETDGIRSFAERSRRATAIGAVLKKIRSPIERHLYLKMAAERLGVDERLMRDTIKLDDRAPGSPVLPDEAAVSSGGQPSELDARNREAAEDPTLSKIARAEEELLGHLFQAPELIAEPEVADTLESFLSPVTLAAARVALETRNLTPAILVDRAGDPEVGSLVSRLATREAPMDARPPLELFRAGAWQLARMRVEREIRKLSREMHEQEREGTLPTDLLKKKVLLTRELEKYKGMSPEPTTPRSS
jgi:DNA primase